MENEYNSPTIEKSNSVGKYIGIAFIIIIILAIIAIIGYFIYKSINSNNSQLPIPADDDSAPIQPSAPIQSSAPIQPFAPVGLWSRFSSVGQGQTTPGYSNGLTYSESQTYCQNNNANLATVDQLKTAGADGFEYCAYGWLSDSNNQVGLYMQETTPGCGQAGYSSISTDSATPWSTYCYGPIPTDITTAQVGSSQIFNN